MTIIKSMRRGIKRELIFSLLIAVFFLAVPHLSIMAQDGPVLGRPDKPTPPPTNPSNNTGSTRKVKKVIRRPANVAKSAVPKGKPLEFYVRKGSELIDEGDFDLAVQYFDEADRKRNDRGVTPELIELLDKQAKVAKLHLDADDLIETDPEKALSSYQEILNLRPNDQRAKEQLPPLYDKVASIALEKKEYARAVEMFSQIVALTPEDSQIKAKLVTALVGKGEQEYKEDKLEVAEKSFKRVLELDPQNSIAQARLQALDIMGILEFAENKLKNGAYEDALIKFKEVLSLDPNNERAKQALPLAQGNYQKQKAEQLYNNRKYQDSQREFKEALALLPEDDLIKRRLDELVLRLTASTPAKGKSSWKGTVNGSTKVTIKGNQLSYPSGNEVNATLSEQLPGFSYVVKRVKKVSGTAGVRLLENPSASNGYATVVAVEGKKNEVVSFDIEWEVKRSGIISWKGNVVDRSLIRAQGSFVDVEQPNGEVVKDATYQGDALPFNEMIVKVKKISGKGELKVVEMPSSSNYYVTTIAVEGGDVSEPLAFELNWQLK